MPFKMGPWEIALILVIILIVFGVGKLPQVGNAIGKGIRSFKKGQAGEEDEEEKGKETVAASPKKTTKKKAA
ncbi:MAG TPA: twin-arginine translocase TatA/TatE family subunit [Dehalococcoidales bacterium]|nr:twin-arginine translocase TatA/TatE family subunit [Dehalococcoidales bacterium]